MIIPSKTLQNGFSLPVLGLGTWHMGGQLDADFSEDEKFMSAMHNALDSGISHIDTAEMYGGGHTEDLIGKVIACRDRSTIKITSKVWLDHLRYDDVLRSCEQTLKRLGTSYVDLYLIHWPSRFIPLEETIKAMDSLVEKGLTKAIGVSNFSKDQLDKARRLSKHPIVCNQVYYNLLVREQEQNGVLDYCQNNDVFLTAYRPLKGAIVEAEKPLPEILLNLCKKYNKTPVQIALNWLISQKNIVTIVKVSTKTHLDDALGSVGWSLSDDDIKLLKTEFPDQMAQLPENKTMQAFLSRKPKS